MKTSLQLLAVAILVPGLAVAQGVRITEKQEKDIRGLVDTYSAAREAQDRTLLESILTADIDQLVSSGEWRRGKEGSMQGMGRSSEANPGTRTLTVEHVRLLSPEVALADARYVIRSPQGATRNMWSTFVVVQTDGKWRISAIRNMLPASQ
jgi:uncharacterized protein (TIGR02246 family)